MPEELLTIKEIAQRLNVPESNIRYYRDKFERFLPYVGEGRKRRYKPEALEIFAFIVNEFAQNKSSEEVEKILAQKFSQNPQISFEENENISPKLFRDNHFHLSPIDKPEDFLQELARSQSRTLEKMAEAINQGQQLRAHVSVLEQGYKKVKKALWLLWQEQKKQPTISDSRQINDVWERLEELESKVQSILERQQKLEEKMGQELESLKESMSKCEFWTKRLMLQFPPKK